MVDNGSEFGGNDMDRWTDEKGVNLHFIRPAKPTEKANILSFNGRLRDECLNANLFYELSQAKKIILQW